MRKGREQSKTWAVGMTASWGWLFSSDSRAGKENSSESISPALFWLEQDKALERPEDSGEP